MIFKNFFSFIKENKAVFTVFMLTQICTVIAFLSVFNYAMKFVDDYKQLQTECRTFTVILCNGFVSENQDNSELDASIDKFYQKHKGMISGIEASVNNGDDVIRAKYTYSDEDVFVGRSLSEQDLSSGEKLIIKPNPAFESTESNVANSDIYELFGEKYTVIGIGLDDRYTVAYSSLNNNVPITGLSVTFNRDLNNTEFSLMIKELKDTFSVDEVKTPEPYSMNIYSQAVSYLLAFGIILVIAFMNIVYLYSYVMGKRRKESAVFRICGSNIMGIAKMYFVELVIISLAAYFVGLLVHLFCIMPIMMNITSTIGYFITPFEYIAIYLAYFIIELLVFIPIIIKIAKTSPSILNCE